MCASLCFYTQHSSEKYRYEVHGDDHARLILDGLDTGLRFVTYPFASHTLRRTVGMAVSLLDRVASEHKRMRRQAECVALILSQDIVNL